ncbi:MAG TPA: YeeE/YedE thiosulfate transporter family protein [Croceibacterium sp.]|nr:YeeE/YedE thiosulfate transporter family protein [Croceibacterium sp.]
MIAPSPETILFAVIGGLLIGSAAGLLLILSGRVAGVSGMAAAALGIADSGPPWRQAAAFTVGLPIGAAAVALLVGRPEMTITASVPLLVAGGLLVGFGTRLGNGCTSGHGVCGLARLSPRSLAAVGTFMAAGIATVFVARQLLGAG